MTRLEDRLRRALRDGAGRRAASDSDWDEFESRLARPTRRRWGIGWRAPLIAAAAVAIIAVTTSAIVTGGFGLAGRDTASGAGTGTPVTISIAPPTVAAHDAGGAVDGGPSTGASPAGPSPIDTAPGTVTLMFAGGQPPQATLRWRLAVGGASTPTAGYDTTSDGSPLGYVDTTGPTLVEGHRYLWGAVGPNVAQVQIGVVQPPRPGDVDPGFHVGPHWTIDSGTGTAFSLPEAATTVWTDLGGGWHGFAVQIPRDATSASVVALSARGEFTQIREFDLAAGTATDQPLPEQTTPPAATGTRTTLSPGAPDNAPDNAPDAPPMTPGPSS